MKFTSYSNRQEKPSEKPQKHVALLIETSNEYSRGLLSGIKSYMRTHRPWSIYLGEYSRREADLSWLHHWQGDGIIARIENEETAAYVKQLQLPTVDLSASRLVPDLPCVETDNQMIAHWAAEHFISRGFKHYAYCGDPAFLWSVQRCDHYISYLEQLGYHIHTFQHQPAPVITEERMAMAAWVQQLPKPIGIMACYDITAQKLLEACRLADVSVPEEVAVIGVDNDDLLCNLATPPLSSIQPDTEKTGYIAASLLDQMMSGAYIEPRIFAIEPLHVITRMSSDIIAVEDPYVSEAIRFIREHAYEDLLVDDLLRHIPLSRRSLDHRFVRALGRTAHEEIVQVRMKQLIRLLTESDWTLPQIAERLNFKHAEYMSVAFKKFTGLSPGAYRDKHRMN
jgi:LacI family transcriptional regulator